MGGRPHLEIAFESKELRDICEVEAEAKGRLGENPAEMLRHRLADMDAATSPKDLLAGQPRLSQNGQVMLIDLCEGYRIVIAPNHPYSPTTFARGLDWEKVRSIRILRIESDHA